MYLKPIQKFHPGLLAHFPTRLFVIPHLQPETHSKRNIAAFLALCPKVASETEEGTSIAPDLNHPRSVTPREFCPNSYGVVDTVIDSLFNTTTTYATFFVLCNCKIDRCLLT
ncbi:hypothetical protein NPIL_440411 [Nephila pilipes]|uniref:Uncharacterized protein n=1 Tax=Nephila pilipes TaxID=299642 RepID=A0A8X6TG18_NEPPI|nr:hypothetical protein NPIL_440411 [Nephila pilipes]